MEDNNFDMDIDNAWENFLEDGRLLPNNEEEIENIIDKVPKGTNLYISTKTKITYLSSPIDLYNIFWKLSILPYHKPHEGIIKKQMKFNFLNEEDLIEINKKMEGLKNVDDMIITEIRNPEGRIKFKVIKKISIGMCSKDITSYRSKKKGAFYNCFVLILRLNDNGPFREIHVKVFNTGKLEIPGIRCDKLLLKVMRLLISILKDATNISDLTYNNDRTETVLINSNFNCGFYINREKLFDILKYEYQISSIFDPCSYPGIQCKYKYDTDKKVSFMIFRTGSVLIVGKCDEKILYEIYEFIKNLLVKEYSKIYIKNIDQSEIPVKTNKIKKKIIYID